MPYPAKVTLETILQQTRLMIETEGVEALSLNKLAAALAIKAPSLYRHVASKSALLRALNTATASTLITNLLQTIEPISPSDPHARLIAIAYAYRAFAHASPVMYDLAYTNTLPDLRPDPAETEQMVLPLQAVMANWVGEERSLPALRGLLALMHGFVMLELNAQFQRGGDLDEAFAASVRAFLAGWRC